MRFLRRIDPLDMTIWVLISLLVIGLFGIVYAAAVSPSCEERGGYLKFSHYQYIPILIGKSTTMIPHSIYVCIIPGESSEAEN